MTRDESSRKWVEAQLLREMAQVKAPEGLWTRIQAEQRARRALPRTGWMLWPVVATVMILASGDLLWQSVNAASERFPRAAERVALRPKTLVAGASCQRCHPEAGIY